MKRLRNCSNLARTIALSIFLVMPNISAQSNTLPDMGSSINKVLPLSMEQELGDYYMRILRQQIPVINDPQIRNYINELGFRLVAANEDAKDRQFYFFVVNDASLNAFAMPGGYIAVNTGLVQNADTESELAGVLAHEIAHVTQRHLARRLEQQQHMSIPSLLATLGAILLMTQNAEAGIAAMTGVQAGTAQIMINHTRTNESEADRIGILTLANAGYDPLGMAKFFEKLLQFSRYSKTRLAFLSTHPLNQTRISEARDRARNLSSKVTRSDFNFNLFKQRLANFLPRDHKQVKRNYEQKIANYQQDEIPVAIEFGYALTLTQLSEYKKSKKILLRLIENYPDSLYFPLALAELQVSSGDSVSARDSLKIPYKLNPGNDPITMSYARALLENNEVTLALDVLYEHLPRVETEPSIYQIIAEAQAKDGLFKEVHESTGLYLYYSGDLQGSLAQFKMAMSGRSSDPYFNSRLLARIHKVQKEILHTH